jgi:hypothetical protein
MALSTKPETHADRDKIVSAIGTYREGSEPDAAVITLDDRIFAPARTKYVSTQLAYQQSVSTWSNASDAADKGDEGFDRDFRLWVKTVTDPAGKSLSGQLSKFMGGTKPGNLVNLPYRKELNKINSLFNKLPENPNLSGDPEKLATLKTTVGTFEPLVKADEAATRDMIAKGKEATKAMVAFDRAYAKFLKAVRALLGDQVTFAFLPRFEA